LEIKGFESTEDQARHNAARKWVSAVNNWGELGRWEFHVCRDPHLLTKELAAYIRMNSAAANAVRSGE
jgi:type III restriction enzyme